MARTPKPLTELRDADVRRVDAVKGAANGTRFLLAKAAAGDAGIVSDEEVRALIAPPPETPAADTYVGAAGEIVKAELTTDARNNLESSDFAYTDEAGEDHYPIQDAAHVRNALSRAAAAINEGGDAADTARKALPKIKAAAKRMGIGEPAAQVAKRKEIPMASPSLVTAAQAKDARALLKRAKLAKAGRKLQKRALLAKVRGLPVLVAKGNPTIKSLQDAHEALLEAIASETSDGDTAEVEHLTQLAAEVAECMAGEAAETDEAGESADDGEDAEMAKRRAPISLKKAKKVAKAAKLEKKAMRDRAAIAKARATITKIGRRNSATDQAHVDGIDEHAAALGATAHQQPATGAAVVAKATGADTSDADTIALIQKAMAPMLAADREAMEGDLARMSEQITKIAKTAMPGGARVLLERDGSIVAASDGQRGLSPEQALLAKAAEHFPVGSNQREELSKAAATAAIKDLMTGR